jgi:predicted phosphodiesterase
MKSSPSKGSGRVKRFVICGDNHGDEQDDASVAALFQFCSDFKPDIVVHLGDNWDFRNLRTKASNDEKTESMTGDYLCGKAFLEKYFSMGSERYFLRGNHDERLWNVLGKTTDGNARTYAEKLIGEINYLCRKLNVKMLPYDSRLGVLKIGHLQVIHGYHCGISACSQHARIYGNCVFGHVHSVESLQVPGLDTKEARSIGCMCSLDIKYMSTKTGKLRWANGWAYGVIHADGTYSIYQTRKINGKFYAASEIKPY